MTIASQKDAAKKFANYWKDKGYEKGQSQPFWLSLLREVYGIAEPEKFITFEDQVHLDNTSFIDGYIDSTHVMIEQKSLGKDLKKPIKQSDGRMLTPYEQAKRYSQELPYSKRPRWIVTSNFESFLIYDMEHPGVEPQVILLKDLPEEFWRMEFLVDFAKTQIRQEQEISLNAGIIVRHLYDALAECYGDMTDKVNQKSLNKLIVRLVFCLYAEDAEMFGHCQFQDYLKNFDAEDLSDALYRLFEVLDTPEEERRRGLKPILAAFPYTNGGLFHDKEDADDTEIPPLTEEVKRILVDVAAPFSWQKISPTIFGGIFESTLNPETRRSGGMHYTSVENIHKVIDPLFLDDLKAEFYAIRDDQPKTTERVKYAAWRQKLSDFQNKLASLKFLDPACGSGNFLTETYLSLRRLENEVIRILFGEGMLGLENDLIKVSIQQFYGIEINDFAVAVATTALWISEAQTLRETEDIISQVLPALPLKNYENIHEGNALRMGWNEVIPASELNYIMGNPPFIGHQWRSQSQVVDMDFVFAEWDKYGKLDYVAAWYKKAVDYVGHNPVLTAYVSTNSLVQGESVATLWKPLFEQYGVEIFFAYRTFVWNSEATDKAHVHCVIIGFTTCHFDHKRRIYDGDSSTLATNINGYLLDAPSVFIQNRGSVLVDGLPKMSKGSQPTDGGNLIMSQEERAALLAKYPCVEPLIHRYISAEDYIQNKTRYCLWLKGVSPSEYRNIPPIMERIEAVAKIRLCSPTASVRRDAEIPMLFTQIRQPESNYLVVPEVSSQRRKYIPIGYLTPDVVASNKLYLVPDATLYLFGVIVSVAHMGWMRVVAGRLKSDYSYSPAVYNNFPWPEKVTDAQKAKIEHTAQAILDARTLYPDSSLADLYDCLTMPTELRKAHRANDAAVMEAYGFRKDMTEPEIVAELFKMYQKLVIN